MATLEELRQKRLQEIQSRQDSNSIDISRQRRLAELKTRNSAFAEKPKEIQDAIDTGTTAGEAFRRSAAVGAAPMIGGIFAGAKTGAAVGTLGAGPLGTIAGFVGGGIVGAIITKKAQDEVLEVVKGEEWKRNLDQSIAEDRQNHPYATLLGEAAPALITFKPSPTTMKQAFNLSKRILTDKKSVAKHLNTLEGKTELDALINVGVGAGVDVSLETYQQVREGDINAIRILGSAVIGGVLSDPNRVGVKMGFKPTGDAVIEEYNKFGSQTEAANIVAKGDIPVIDRSSDVLFKERQETLSILRGEGEANRFTEPRILQAEKIAGTIDKDITPDSDLNIYRLDGRSGPMRVGERVTANPHIADVYGGRINPEAVVKAGDLVRTSKGDYIYIPKEEIEARPKLPPVTTAVDKATRKEVIGLEKKKIEETKAKAREAVRKAEEPARLQREAEELAAKQQAEAERRFREETRQAEATKLRLKEEIRKVRAETQKRIAADKIEVQKKKVAIDKKKDSDIVTVTKQLRKELDKAILEHTRRMEKAKTKMQKAKENIRFKNQKADLNAKAVKEKKAIREKARADKTEVVSRAKEIREEAKETVARKNKEIKEIPKPKLEKTTPPKKQLPKREKPVDGVKKINRLAKNSLINQKTGDRSKSLEYLRENPDRVADGEVRLREIEDGEIFIEDGRHRLQVAAETGVKPKIVDVTAEYTGKPSTKIAKLIDAVPEAKTKTIGTKVTKSKSIIKNAVEEANQAIKEAERAGVDMTTQTGTTFVEQRKLSAEILADRGFDDALALARDAGDGELGSLGVSRSALYEVLYKTAIKEGQFNKYRDDLEDLALRVADIGSVSAQELSLQRMATANDPFRRIAQLKKAIREHEKKVRGSVFDKEIDDLRAKIDNASTEEDMNKIINDNLC